MSRLDVVMMQRGYAKSRAKAKSLITEGRVTVGGEQATKPSQDVDDNADISVAAGDDYVSRAAHKLARAHEVFSLSFDGCHCLDIGASTGGFTEFMLAHGAKKVIAVDVGKGQLDESLACDARVINLEETNVKDLDIEALGAIHMITVDVSFISLSHILPVIAPLISKGATAVVLIKPQFEVGRSKIGKNGIVKRAQDHVYAIDLVNRYIGESGLFMHDVTPSPIKGAKGNIEFLALVKHTPSDKAYSVKEIVRQAHTR